MICSWSREDVLLLQINRELLWNCHFVFVTFLFWGRRSFQIRYAAHFLHGLAMIFLRDSLCLSAVSISRQRHDILDFPIVPCHAFCMWHWPIGKDLDLSFIWGHHHLHIVGFVNISRPAEYSTACYTVLKRPNKVETAVHGCNLAFSLDSIVSLPC